MKTQKNYSKDPLIDAITSEDLLGKDVIDPEGSLLGVSERLFLDKKKMSVIGISVDQGFLRKALVISTHHIVSVTKHAIIIDQKPVVHLKGMKVFDHTGKLIGSVHDILRADNKNKVQQLIIKTSPFSRKKIFIDSEFIDRVGDNIVLTDDYAKQH